MSTHDSPSVISSTVAKSGDVYALAASDTAIYAGTTALLSFPNTGDVSAVKVQSIPSGVRAIKSIVVSDGRIFTAHQDGKIRVRVPFRRIHLNQIADITALSKQEIRSIFSIDSLQARRHQLTFWRNHFDAITALAVSNGLLYCTSWNGTLKVWSLSDFNHIESVQAHDDAICGLAVSADGTVYTGSADASIKIWSRGRTNQHSLLTTLEMHQSAVNALVLSSDDRVLYSGSSEGSILVWEKDGDADEMAFIGTLSGHETAVLCLAYASELLASGSADNTIRIWRQNINNQYSCIAVLEGHERPVKSLVIAPDESTSQSVLIYSGSLGGEIKAWRVSRC